MLSALPGCGRSEKQTAGTKLHRPWSRPRRATEALEPQTLGEQFRCGRHRPLPRELAVNGNYGVEYEQLPAPLPGGFDGVGEWYPVTNYGSLSELRRHACSST